MTSWQNILGKICSNLQLQIDLLYIISIIIITIIYMETAYLVQENSTTKKNIIKLWLQQNSHLYAVIQ